MLGIAAAAASSFSFFSVAFNRLRICEGVSLGECVLGLTYCECLPKGFIVAASNGDVDSRRGGVSEESAVGIVLSPHWMFFFLGVLEAFVVALAAAELETEPVKPNPTGADFL